MKNAINMKRRLLDGETLTFVNDNDDLINVWFQSQTGNFCLEVNARVVKAVKTIQPIMVKLNDLNVSF